MSSEYLLSGIIGAIVLAAGLLIQRLIAVIKDAVDRGHDASIEAMKHMQDNHARLAHKMEDWHDQAIRAERAHTERVMEIAASPEAHVAVTARQHGLERHEEHVTAADHSTNERRADLMELAQRGVPPPEKPPQRVPVDRSKASRARAAINEGKIPERHA